MHRFYLPPSECSGSSLALTGREAHHAAHVLRIRTGDPVTVLDGAGRVIQCKAAEVHRAQVSLDIVEQRSVPPLPFKVTLAQAIPKGTLFEDIVQQATELGVSRVVPLVSERVVARPSTKDVPHKIQKWRQVAIEAVKQCGSPWLPEIDPPTSIEKFLPLQTQIELPLVASLAPQSQHPRSFFDQFARTHGKKPATISVAIGPEGDFTAQELAALETSGAGAISLGPLVLRTVTAAVYCLAVINYELRSF